MDSDELDQYIEYVRFYRRAVLTKMLDARYIGASKEQEVTDPYIAQFNATVNTYAQVKNVSLEESYQLAFEELDKIEDRDLAKQIKADLESSIKQANEHASELDDKREVFPNTYVAEKINEALAENLGLPKVALYPAARKMAVPSLGLVPNLDNRTLY